MKNKLQPLITNNLINEIISYCSIYPFDIKLLSCNNNIILGIHNGSGRCVCIKLNDRKEKIYSIVKKFRGIAIIAPSIEEFKRQIAPYVGRK